MQYVFKMLKKKVTASVSLSSREEKWHETLNCDFSVEFWKKVYSFTGDIQFDNKYKWLQFQINRHSLYTNSRVHKFNHQVSPLCTFCTQSTESIFHLFYGCSKVLDLLKSIKQWLATIGSELDISKLHILFGKLDERPTSINNFILLSVKYFVWKCRLSCALLSLDLF